MSLIQFRVEELAVLLNELCTASRFTPTIEDLFDPKSYKDGKPRNAEGLTVEESGDLFWPSAKHVESDSVSPAVQLVGDHGVYLITNADLPGNPASRDAVVYALGCNPKDDEEFYETKRRLFGGDDGSVKIPPSWLQKAIESGQQFLTIRLNEDSVELVA